MAENDEDRKVKVVDRRWFTQDGELRDPVPASPPAGGGVDAPVSEQPSLDAPTEPEGSSVRPPETLGGDEVPAERTAPSSDPRADGVPGPPGFFDLVDSLAQPAAAYLSGQVPGRGTDLNAARHYIDLLGVLETKTRDHLTVDEKSVLEDVLYQLRSLYVAASR